MFLLICEINYGINAKYDAQTERKLLNAQLLDRCIATLI